jgi:hypothetical protein
MTASLQERVRELEAALAEIDVKAATAPNGVGWAFHEIREIVRAALKGGRNG